MFGFYDQKIQQQSINQNQETLRKLIQTQSLDNFEIIDVQIDDNQTIQTLITGTDGCPNIVFIHGYGSGIGIFFKTLKDLEQTNKLYIFDIIGMGGSSRPDFTCKTPEETIELFMNSIEQWRIKLNLDKFILVGHSFGGYLAGLYSVKYKEKVQKLILISPIGLSLKEDMNQRQQEILQKKQQLFFVKIVKYFWNKQISPFAIPRTFPKFLVSSFIKKRVQIRLGGHLNNEETNKILEEYVYQIITGKESTELAIYQLFEFGFFAHQSLGSQNFLANQNFDVPFVVVYGDNDWVFKIDKFAAQKLIDRNGSQQNRVIMVENSDHNLTVEQPEKIVQIIKDQIKFIQ